MKMTKKMMRAKRNRQKWDQRNQQGEFKTMETNKTGSRGWSTEGYKEATACSYCADKEDRVVISNEVMKVIKDLCEHIKVEWQMLLIGNRSEEGELIITDYYICKQEVTSATVKNLDCVDKKFIEDNSIVATIHSHAEMGVFFSSTDDEFTNNSLIETHIVVNNRGDFTAQTRLSLACGMVKMIKCKVMYIPDTPVVKDYSYIKGLGNIVEASVVHSKTWSYGTDKINKNDSDWVFRDGHYVRKSASEAKTYGGDVSKDLPGEIDDDAPAYGTAEWYAKFDAEQAKRMGGIDTFMGGGDY